jgi:hypothetical protein
MTRLFESGPKADKLVFTVQLAPYIPRYLFSRTVGYLVPYLQRQLQYEFKETVS